MNDNYIVVTIGKNKDDDYPDNKKYFHLCKYVEDEEAQFRYW